MGVVRPLVETFVYYNWRKSVFTMLTIRGNFCIKMNAVMASVPIFIH